MNKSKCISICCVGSGVFLVAFGLILGYAIFPLVVDMLIKEELDLWNPESEGRKNFEQPPVPVYMNFWIFDVQNPDDIKAGTAKPNLKERGPYAYKEIRKKIEVGNQSESSCYIKAGQYKAYVFDKDKSCKECNEDDDITMINAPLIGLVEVFKKKGGAFANYLPIISTLAETGCYEEECKEEYKDSLFIKTKVGEFIFGGYKRGVIKWVIEGPKWPILANAMPPQITKDIGFAVFNGKNNTANNEYYELDTAYCEGSEANSTADYDASDMKNYLQIRKWGATMKKLKEDLNSTLWWTKGGGYNGSNACNLLEGTDGQQFHPDLQDDEKLWIFSTDLCRSMFLTYQDDVEVEGIPTLQYAPPFEALQVNTTQNVGFCMQHEKAVDWSNCIKPTSNENILNLTECFNSATYTGSCHDGVLDISSCQKEAPVIMSSPHFYQNPKFLLDKFDGISPPKADLHETRLWIEPTTGMTIKLNKRIQINIPMNQDDRVALLSEVNTTSVFPMIWVDESADIDEENVDKLKEMVVIPTRAVLGVQWVAVIAGAVMVLGVGIKLLVSRR